VRAATQVADGEAFSVESISTYATTDLAYELEIHRFRAKIGGADELAPISIRVTTIYRREDEGWRVVHRHADPITGERSVESIAQS
jgi:ketosteroid isomerase-like protein